MRSIAAANSSGSPGETSSAAPSRFSANEDEADAIVGTPHAIASSGGKPNPSSSDGYTNSDAKISRQSAVEDISLLAVEENPILIFPVDPGQMQHELHHVPIYSGWFRQ